MQLKQWKKPKKLQRIMIKVGFAINKAKRTWVKMNRYQSIMRREVRFVMNLQWFKRQELIFLNDFTRMNLA